MRSLWEKEVVLNSFPKSEGDTKTDVLIVGGYSRYFVRSFFAEVRRGVLFGRGGKNCGRCYGTYHCEDYIAAWAAQDCMSLDGIPYIGEYSKGSRNIYVAAGFNKWGMTSAMVAGKLLSDLILEKRTEYEALYSPSRPMLTKQLAINAGESLLGLLSFSTKRCPHLGCALKWNREEHSWDCPCHGLRKTAFCLTIRPMTI